MNQPAFDFEAIRKISTQSIPFASRSGIDLLEFERGRVKMVMPFQGNQNHVGIMYAGALFTLAEIPGGALFASAFDMSQFFPIVAEMNIRFLKPATTDITVEATLSDAEIARITQEVEANGKSVFVLEQELKDANGQVVAVSTGTYQARSHQRRPKNPA
jgi:thioesterase domain-containing protein